MDLRELAMTIPAVDGHAHSPLFFSSSADAPMCFDEMHDLFPRFTVLTTLPEEETQRLAREPGGWRDYQEDVERHRGERATTYAESSDIVALCEIETRQAPVEAVHFVDPLASPLQSAYTVRTSIPGSITIRTTSHFSPIGAARLELSHCT